MNPATHHGLTIAGALALALAALLPQATARAEDGGEERALLLGFIGRAGGRYDNVRLCVASPEGAKGGIAADVSLFAEVGLDKGHTLNIDLPFFRPIMFGLNFDMLQFEPSVTYKVRVATDRRADLIIGPIGGISLNYGPDYQSATSGPNRGPSFFSMGPTFGAYVGSDFKRPGKTFNFQLGLSSYVTPLFGVNDPAHHRGVVVGALLDAVFRFRVR